MAESSAGYALSQERSGGTRRLGKKLPETLAALLNPEEVQGRDVRQFVYVYGAVSPIEGDLDWMICPNMNTERMGEYLAQVSAAHPDEFIVMVVDGASSHVAKDLAVPENIRLLRLPAYSPELNPQEHVWNEIREKEFPNRVFADLPSVTRQLESGLPRLAAERERLRSLTAGPWIIRLNLSGNCNEYQEVAGTEQMD